MKKTIELKSSGIKISIKQHGGQGVLFFERTYPREDDSQSELERDAMLAMFNRIRDLEFELEEKGNFIGRLVSSHDSLVTEYTNNPEVLPGPPSQMQQALRHLIMMEWPKLKSIRIHCSGSKEYSLIFDECEIKEYYPDQTAESIMQRIGELKKEFTDNALKP